MPTFTQHPDVVMVPTDDDAFILVDGAGTKMITLNELGGLIWNHLDRQRSLDDVVDACAAEYPSVPRDTLTADVTAFLDEVSGLGLVDRSGD
ncbi:MAG: PqqD family protein [Actinomycetota bacterium]